MKNVNQTIQNIFYGFFEIKNEETNMIEHPWIDPPEEVCCGNNCPDCDYMKKEKPEPDFEDEEISEAELDRIQNIYEKGVYGE